ncbi:MAG: flagellar basal body rod protein FlgB [Proteobacteria bacterium]|nr:flagellar basal body rod protein FlgB [Pseudomonadota bacterium]
MMELFDRTINSLSALADFRAQRHKVIVSNITNIDVPDYESKELNFKKELGTALDKGIGLTKTDGRHLPATTESGNQDVVATGQRVKIDKEMGNLAENQLMYNLSIELLARKFRSLTNVLKEAR